MSVLPANTSSQPPVEALFFAGWLKNNYYECPPAAPLGIGATYTGAWEDVSGYCEFRLIILANVASAVGGVHFEWSMDGVNPVPTFVEVPGTALAGIPYDSGVIAFHAPFVRVRYTNGGAIQASFQLRMVVSPTAIAGGGGGGPAANVNIISPLGIAAPAAGVSVTATANQGSLLEPNPASILAAASQPETREPDGSLRVRARALTDEGSFAGNFASLYRALTGSPNITFTTGSRAVTGVGSLFTQEVRIGDYVEITAQHSDTVPVLAQVQSVESNLALTLRDPYTGGAGAVTAAAQVSDWYVFCTANAGDGIAVAAPNCGLTLGATNGSLAYLARRLGPGQRKGCAPLRGRFLLSLSARNANQETWFGFSNHLPPIANLQQLAVLQMRGAAATNIVATLAARDVVGGLVGGSYQGTLPPGQVTTSQHIYEIDLLEDQVDYLAMRRRIPLPPDVEYQQGALLPDPYEEMYALVFIQNTGASAAATLTVGDVHVKSLDMLDARVVSPEAGQNYVSNVDLTPNGPALAATTAVAVDAVVNIAPTVAGQEYRFSVDGGAGFCIRVDGVDPVVTDECWYDGMKENFVATVTSASGVRAIKKTAGTANGSVTVANRV